MTPQRHSKQRDAILDNLRSRYDNPTAEDIYFDLKKTFPSLSLATVYRNLSQLADDGTVLRINTGGAVHFDGNSENHYHLVCRDCLSVIDVEMPVVPTLNADAEKSLGGKILTHTVIFNGLCKNCI